MEPHACIAVWDGGPAADDLRLDAGRARRREDARQVFGLEPDDVRVIAPYVGGGLRLQGDAARARRARGARRAAVAGRPVKLALTRQQMFALVGYRTATLQRVRLGADADGRLRGIVPRGGRADLARQGVRRADRGRHPDACTPPPHRRTTHRLVPLDVAVPSWMRAPGETPGMFALESAMDELAEACGIDPVELRVRNDPRADPESGLPWSSAHLVECLRQGAERFGWHERGLPAVPSRGRLVGRLRRRRVDVPRLHHAGLGRVGQLRRPRALRRAHRRRRHRDRRRGPRSPRSRPTRWRCRSTGCTSRSATRGCRWPRSRAAPRGSSSHGSAIVAAARKFREEHGSSPADGAVTESTQDDHPDLEKYSAHSFGAQFVEVRVDADTGEVRVPRAVGVFSAGRIVNPRTARSQLRGGMVWGLSMALHEHSVVDHRFGHVVTQDLADYHVPAHADIVDLDVTWLDETDPHANVLGAQGHRRDRHHRHRGRGGQRRLQRRRPAGPRPADHARPAGAVAADTGASTRSRRPASPKANITGSATLPMDVTIVMANANGSVTVSSQAEARGTKPVAQQGDPQQRRADHHQQQPGQADEERDVQERVRVVGPLRPVVAEHRDAGPHVAGERDPPRPLLEPRRPPVVVHHEGAQRERDEHRQPDLAVGDVDQVRAAPVQQRPQRAPRPAPPTPGSTTGPGHPCRRRSGAGPARAAGRRPAPPTPSPTRTSRSCGAPRPTRTSLPPLGRTDPVDARSAEGRCRPLTRWHRSPPLVRRTTAPSGRRFRSMPRTRPTLSRPTLARPTQWDVLLPAGLALLGAVELLRAAAAGLGVRRRARGRRVHAAGVAPTPHAARRDRRRRWSCW